MDFTDFDFQSGCPNDSCPSRCPNDRCPYCIFAHSERESYFNEHPYSDDDNDIGSRCPYCSHNPVYGWTYNYIGSIMNFHPEDGDSLINQCETIAEKFLDEVSNNDVCDATCAELDKLFGYGCYVRNFIMNIFRDTHLSVLDKVIESGSVQTFYKYIQYASAKFGHEYYLIDSLYNKNRFDILEASKNSAYKSIGLDRDINRETYYAIQGFMESNTQISVEMKEYLIKYFGAERVIQIFKGLNVEFLN